MDEKQKLQSWYIKKGEPKPAVTKQNLTFEELIKYFKEVSKEIEKDRENNKRLLQSIKDNTDEWPESIYKKADIEQLKQLKPALTSRILMVEKLYDVEQDPADKEEYRKTLDKFRELKDALDERIAFYPKTLEKIDAQRLGAYFVPAFKGQGNGRIDYFSMMIEELNTERTAKEFGQIALMIWNSPHGNSRLEEFEHFSKWYYEFCQCVGCEHKTYDRNKLKDPSKALKSLFSYLQ